MYLRDMSSPVCRIVSIATSRGTMWAPSPLSAREAAALLGIHHTTLYEAAKRGDVPCRRVGRRFIFTRESLVDWLRAPASATE